MPLTTTIAYNSGTQAATATFYYPNPSTLVDTITYSSGSFTFNSSSGFNPDESDMLLYIQAYFSFNSFIIDLFPGFQTSSNKPLPVCSFELSSVFEGVTHVNFAQTSNGNVVNTINYVPIAVAGSIASRSSITITPQEWINSNVVLNQYYNQIVIS